MLYMVQRLDDIDQQIWFSPAYLPMFTSFYIATWARDEDGDVVITSGYQEYWQVYSEYGEMTDD